MSYSRIVLSVLLAGIVTLALFSIAAFALRVDVEFEHSPPDTPELFITVSRHEGCDATGQMRSELREIVSAAKVCSTDDQCMIVGSLPIYGCGLAINIDRTVSAVSK